MVLNVKSYYSDSQVSRFLLALVLAAEDGVI